ncbi:BrnA antitoxin of type II toxin-antitoxin system [Nitrosomonas sp. Nm84]|uniref:BrnA antitoxin family protein n=1 Tax=Nitrosomonas sp. Nm84 TaxID=200124 RepID=UPI000D756C6D|nr:BrnA antitoxin family protein [Nitrosomonas sp. Nm84]PXW79994.1 BrnA antitoxin of type II toxin-antitoxin system [Nitrosomonas sp. Nm84]
MQIKTKSGRILELPSPEEDAQITAAALTDPDNLPLTDAELGQFKRGRGRPQGSGKKEQVTLRIDTEILEQFRATGNGWQTRINDALRDWMKQH